MWSPKEQAYLKLWMTNPYIQKLPSKLRNCLVAKIPTLWIIVDFAQTGLVIQIVCLPSTITLGYSWPKWHIYPPLVKTDGNKVSSSAEYLAVPSTLNLLLL